MKIALSMIHDNPWNTRVVAPAPDADANLAQSLATLGQLQPILVKPYAPGEWVLLAGHRRVRAARALAWESIEAMELQHDEATAPMEAISAAENMARAGMHPVDQWRAIVALRDEYTVSVAMAAAMLGIAPALAKRLEHLGRMAPELLEEIAKGELPASADLRIIAMAPLDAQREALARAQRSMTEGRYFWRTVATACTVQRIPQSRAIFPLEAMTWEEDLFAQADDADRFTTADVEGFLARQTAALAERAEKSNGRMTVVPFSYAGFERPKGWHFTHDDVPKRWRKDDPRRVLARVVDQGFALGKVEFQMAEPDEAREDSGAPALASAPAVPRPTITKAVQRHLADLKRAGVQTRLAEIIGSIDAQSMLQALLLVFTCRNAKAGELAGSPYGYIAQRLIDPEGRLKPVDGDDLCELAARVIVHAIKFDAPDVYDSSGAGAEWLAMAIEAAMPRTDTAEILKGISGELLGDIAETHGVSARGSVSDLRKRLVGNLPEWRAVDYGAAGPTGATNLDSADSEDTADAGDSADVEDALDPETAETEDAA